MARRKRKHRSNADIISEVIEFQIGRLGSGIIDQLTSTHLRIIGDVTRLDLKAGDIVVLETDLMLTAEQVTELRKRWNEHMVETGKENVHTVILCAGLKVAAVLGHPNG